MLRCFHVCTSAGLLLHALFALDPSSTSEQPGAPNTEATGQTNSGDGAVSSQNNSLLSPNSSSSTMNEIFNRFNRQTSNLSLVSQTTSTSQKSLDSNVFGSDPFSSEKIDDPFGGEDPFGSTSNQNDIFAEAIPTSSDVFGKPTLVQGDTKQQSAKNNKILGKNYGDFEGLFGDGMSSDNSNLAWGSGPALGAGEPSVNASSTNFGFGKCKQSALI